MRTRFIVVVIGTFLKAISPLLRTGIDTLIKQLYEKAKTTDVEIDDILVEALADMLEVDLED